MDKKLHGMSKQELDEYILRRKEQLTLTNYDKYGIHNELVKQTRVKTLKYLEEEIESFFK